ncbi:MAG: two-component sensor histidine kinase [Proteobacteria bacterium]|nr:MAG: two-component sensor histidine kinase [Pseudomonadota bacterium]
MIRSSVFYAITFFFFVSSVSIFLAYLWLVQYDKQNYTNELNQKYSFVSNATLFHLDNNTSEDDLKKQLKIYQMKKIKDNYMQDYVINGAQIIQKVKTTWGSSSILRHKRNHYLLMTYKDKILLLKDDGFEPYRYDIIRLIFAGVFLISFLAYFLTIKKLRPLRKLKTQINKFAKGDLEDVKCKINGNDEIAEVANAFDNAVEQIKKLNSSRQLFLRNIMHELKTPITKGLITAEMIPKDKHQKRLVRSFEKLEELINEFATIEQISSGAKLANKKNYRLVDLLDEAIDLAMIGREKTEIEVRDVNLNVNFKFFCVALKNMIDNGIKYSSNSKVRISTNRNSIDFISKGDKLKKPLSFYIEPFVKENEKEKSFGLGLYIVDNILKSHDFTLSYRFDNGYNTFSFDDLNFSKHK